MAPRMVYFSYPVDQVTGGGNGILVRRLEQCKFELMDQGVDICYDPGDAFNLRAGADVGAEIRDVNQAALMNADAVLAMLPASQPSVAVPMEIETAVQSGCAVAILTDVAAWTLGYDTRRFNVQLFSLTEDGFAHAVIWLAAQARPVLEEKGLESLPFTVMRKAECGKTEGHEPHDWGEFEEQDCHGLTDLTPRKTYDSDAGFDLVVARSMTIWPGEQIDVPMGVAVQLPEWSFGRITGRSSTLRKRGLLINEGIIDESYRGELFALAKNFGVDPVHLDLGDRIAQLILHSNVSASVRPVHVQDLSITARGSKGFGSTGL